MANFIRGIFFSRLASTQQSPLQDVLAPVSTLDSSHVPKDSRHGCFLPTKDITGIVKIENGSLEGPWPYQYAFGTKWRDHVFHWYCGWSITQTPFSIWGWWLGRVKCCWQNLLTNLEAARKTNPHACIFLNLSQFGFIEIFPFAPINTPLTFTPIANQSKLNQPTSFQ